MSTSDHAHDRSKQWVLLGVWLSFVALITLAAFYAQSTSDTSSEQVIYRWSTFGGGLVQEALFAGFAFAMATVLPPVRRTLGLQRFETRFVWLALGVVAASAAVSAALEPVLHAGREQGLTPTTYDASRLAPLLANAILFTFIGPFAEELMFRGLGVTALSILGRTTAILGSATAFGLAHGLLVALPPLVFLGVGLAWIRERSGSIWPGYFAHATFNAIGIAVAVGQAAS